MSVATLPIEHRADADAEVIFGQHEGFQVYDTELTAQRTLLLSSLHQRNGSAFRVARYDNGAPTLLIKQGETLIHTLPARNWVDLVSDGQTWRPSAAGIVDGSALTITQTYDATNLLQNLLTISGRLDQLIRDLVVLGFPLNSTLIQSAFSNFTPPVDNLILENN